jgi:hypothetical protein
MSPRFARWWFAATAVCAVAGITISMVTAVNNQGGHFHPGVARAFNTFAFFTIQSNLVAGAASLLLALDARRPGRAFAVLRLTSLVAITVTGLVFHVALRGVFDLATTWDRVGNELVHTVMPLLTVFGWLLAGPRRLIDRRVVLLSLSFPVAWLAFTLIRGAIAHWYPYPFIDVTSLGYGGALVNCVWVAVLLLGLAALACVVDRRLPGLDVS